MPSDFLKTFIGVSATWFGCGRSPWAPGTVGTLGAIPLVWAFTRWLDPFGYMGMTLVLVVVAVLVAHIYEVMTNAHDAPEFVMDEVVGFLVTMTWIPFGLINVAVGFAIFRALDILKPFPISWVDRRMPGGVGAVADDLLAGVIANVAMQLLLNYGWLR